MQARRYADEGYTVVLIGHEGHEEVVGTMGEAPDATVLVQTVEEAEALDFPRDAKLAYVTQTTLSVDETGEIITALRRRFPEIRAPRKEDICYATSNRQWAVKEMLPEIDLLLVIGSRNSSNSNRLVETSRAAGTPAHLIDDETEIDEAWLDGARTVGITSGASAPEKLVTRVCDWFRARGVTDIEPYRIVEEDVTFRLPVELRRELELAARGLSCGRSSSRSSASLAFAVGGWLAWLAASRARRRRTTTDDRRPPSPARPAGRRRGDARCAARGRQSGTTRRCAPLIPTTGFEYTFGGPVEGGADRVLAGARARHGRAPARERSRRSSSMPYVLSRGLYVWPWAYTVAERDDL